MRQPGQSAARSSLSVACAIAVGIAVLLGSPAPAPAALAAEPAATGAPDPVAGPAPVPHGYRVGPAGDEGSTGPATPGARHRGGPPLLQRSTRGAVRLEPEVAVAGTDRLEPAAAAAGSAWTVETLVSSFETMAPSVQVDASGKVHIAYLRTQTGAGVYYATNASRPWVTQLAWAGAAGSDRRSRSM